MSTGVELLREHKYRELWQRYCGFLDLSIQDFMLIQRRLLLEQMELLKDCELGRHVMRGATPRAIEAITPASRNTRMKPSQSAMVPTSGRARSITANFAASIQAWFTDSMFPLNAAVATAIRIRAMKMAFSTAHSRGEPRRRRDGRAEPS